MPTAGIWFGERINNIHGSNESNAPLFKCSVLSHVSYVVFLRTYNLPRLLLGLTYIAGQDDFAISDDLLHTHPDALVSVWYVICLFVYYTVDDFLPPFLLWSRSLLTIYWHLLVGLLSCLGWGWMCEEEDICKWWETVGCNVRKGDSKEDLLNSRSPVSRFV